MAIEAQRANVLISAMFSAIRSFGSVERIHVRFSNDPDNSDVPAESLCAPTELDRIMAMAAADSAVDCTVVCTSNPADVEALCKLNAHAWPLHTHQHLC